LSMKDETRKRLAFTGEDARFTKQLGATALISVVRRDDLDELLASDTAHVKYRDGREQYWKAREAKLIADNDLAQQSIEFHAKRADAAEARVKELEAAPRTVAEHLMSQYERVLLRRAEKAEAELTEVRDWVVEVRNAVLLPLATQDNDLGKVAAGLDQSTVALLKRLGVR
jgi:hypothetical protein